MRSLIFSLVLCLACFAPPAVAADSQAETKPIPVGQALKNAVERMRLTDSGSAPFHLRAVVGPAKSGTADFKAEIEEDWISPTKWRRTIRATEFEQTVIVNGAHRYEKNSSDYFPQWLNEVVIGLFDVVPPATQEEINGLKRNIPNPDEGWNIKFAPGGTDGMVSMSWTGDVRLDSLPGVLTWISATGFTASYGQFQPFHNKLVPRVVETFPWVPRGWLSTRVELQDLAQIDERLFDIPNPSPASQHIETVQVPEVEYRKLAINSPVVKWPTVKTRPTTGSLVVQIVTDRQGRVRDCHFVISHNMSLGQASEELVKKWRFKPYLVNGVPVQVRTTMTFAFDTTMEGDQAKFQPASFYFKRGRDLTYPRTDNGKPFHLKGTVEGSGELAKLRGSFEETWIAVDRWRSRVKLGVETGANSQLVADKIETRIDDNHYNIQSVNPQAAPIADAVLSVFTGEFPGYAYYSPDTDWNMGEEEYEGTVVTRVGMGHMENGKVDYGRAYYFDREGRVRARTNGD